MKTSNAGVAFILDWEKFREFAYPDPISALARAYPKAGWGFRPAKEILAGLPASARQLKAAPWTVGYGEADKTVTMESTRTKDEAFNTFKAKLARYEKLAMANLKVEPTQGQFDALVAICWNVETAVSASSTIIKCHNRQDWEGASRAFRLYNKGRINNVLQVVEGLSRRRAVEAANYLAASPFEEQDLTQVEAEGERPVRKSEINTAATIGGASVTVAATAEAVKSVKDINDSISDIASWLPLALLFAAVVCFAVIMYQRNKQRKEGWA